ncbi:PH domain-containing protein [Aeromonas salmonicida]
MAYVEKALLADEAVVYKASISWFIFVRPLLMMGAGLLVFLYITPDALDLPPPFTLLISVYIFFLNYAVIAWAMYDFAYSLIRKFTTEIALTNKRVITKLGWIARNTVEIQLLRVEACQIQQSVVGRLLQHGTIVISGAGLGTHPIDYIHRPTQFRGHLLKALADNKQP